MRITNIFVLFALSFIFEGAHAQFAAIAAQVLKPLYIGMGVTFGVMGLKDVFRDEVTFVSD